MPPNDTSKVNPQRLPAPSLFVGPPSRNASSTSLSSPPSARPLPSRQRSHLVPEPTAPKRPSNTSHDSDLASTIGSPSAAFQRRQHAQTQAVEAESASRTDAIWAEMQNTLEEVELSAIKGPGMTVFGPQHERALEELRRAQIELAKAWARSEAEEEGMGEEERRTAGASNDSPADLFKEAKGEKGEGNKSQLEDETEKDIELSRKRREANDRYFEKVNAGVKEVVVRLEEVAAAMKGVEIESKEIWRDGESVDVDSVRTASVG